MTRHLTLEQALRIARAAAGGPIALRDLGLLEAAVHRPRTRVFGRHAYPELPHKAAALLHSLARNHPLADGNTRLAWLATYVFCAKNGLTLDPDDDAAYDLIVAVAAGELENVEEIAAILRESARLSQEVLLRSRWPVNAVLPSSEPLDGSHGGARWIGSTCPVQPRRLPAQRPGPLEG